MEKIIKYKAYDGREFLDSDKCADHEQNCTIASGIVNKIPSKPNGTDFSNGSGYIQHDEANVLAVRNEFLEFVKRYTGDINTIQQTIDEGFSVHPSWAGRMIDECAPNSISKHWYRFMCMDDRFREWGQPFYASNPDSAEQVCLN